MTCPKCHGTGLVRDDGHNLGFCLCPVGSIVWDRALWRAVTEISAEVTP